jgi:hypothetical protein
LARKASSCKIGLIIKILGMSLRAERSNPA